MISGFLFIVCRSSELHASERKKMECLNVWNNSSLCGWKDCAWRPPCDRFPLRVSEISHWTLVPLVLNCTSTPKLLHFCNIIKRQVIGSYVSACLIALFFPLLSKKFLKMNLFSIFRVYLKLRKIIQLVNIVKDNRKKYPAICSLISPMTSLSFLVDKSGCLCCSWTKGNLYNVWLLLNSQFATQAKREVK